MHRSEQDITVIPFAPPAGPVCAQVAAVSSSPALEPLGVTAVDKFPSPVAANTFQPGFSFTSVTFVKGQGSGK
eukprot:1973260-Amphidinium_carterae.1